MKEPRMKKKKNQYIINLDWMVKLKIINMNNKDQIENTNIW
jgi:hypothetical protein